MTSSTVPRIFAFARFAISCAMLLTHPTVGTIQISLRTPADPSFLKKPLKNSCFAGACLLFSCTGSYVYSSRSPSAVLILWTCTHAPALISSLALPIRKPYLMTSPPAGIVCTAILCPAGIVSAAVTNRCCPSSAAASAIVSPAAISRIATITLSFSWIFKKSFIPPSP